MTPAFKKFSKQVFIGMNILAVVFFLLSSAAAYINPGKYWFIGMLGVGFVFFLLLLIAFFIFWLLARSRWALLSLIAIVVGWSQIHALFGFHFFSEFDSSVKPPASLRVVQWNVSSFNELNKEKTNGVTYRQEMFNYLAEQDADILCLQEFFESINAKYESRNIAYISKKLYYPYYYFVEDAAWWEGELKFGTAIFSRYPIVDSARQRYRTFSGKAGESLIRVTVDVNGQKINVFTTHLQSFLFRGEDYQNIETLKRPDNKDRVLEAGKGIASKFRNAYRKRYLQAELVRRELDKSEYPTIITGDFNDVPNSYTYFTIKGDYQDAFVKKGHGLGKTFYFISPTLRIDYILADQQFDVLQYKRDIRPYSDHYPLVADLIIREPKSQ